MPDERADVWTRILRHCAIAYTLLRLDGMNPGDRPQRTIGRLTGRGPLRLETATRCSGAPARWSWR